MFTWKDTVVHSLSKSFPPEVVIVILSFLKRSHISYICEESRDYHVYRMPRVERLLHKDYDLLWTNSSYLNHGFEKRTDVSSGIIKELKEKWEIIDPKDKEYVYYDVWRWSSFEFPYMNFISSFNRGRIFLRFLKGYEWYDINSEDNIVDKLTDYEEITI